MRFSATAGEEAKKPKTAYVPAEIGRAPCCYDWSGGGLGKCNSERGSQRGRAAKARLEQALNGAGEAKRGGSEVR